MKKILIAIGVIFTSYELTAQTVNDSIPANTKKEIDLTQKKILLEEVHVTALRGTAKAPFSRTFISKKDIEKQNLGQDIPFLLNQVPGAVINSDAGNGIGYTGIRIRGIDVTRINMTINGVPYNDAESQGLFFVNLPDLASSTNSIEIQRGVGSSSNGAGAFGATMSFSTSQLPTKAFINFNNSFGSFQSMKNTLQLGTGLKNKMFFEGRISNIQSNGYIDRAKTNLKSAMATVGYLHNNTQITFNAILGKEKTYQAWYGVDSATLKNNRTFNSAGTEKSDAPYENETDNYWQNHYQFIINQKLKKDWKLSSTLFYTRGYGYFEQYKANQDYSDYGLPNVGTATQTDLIRQLWLDNHFYGKTFALIHSKNRSNLTLGGMASQYKGKHYGQIPWSQLGIAKNYKWYNLDAVKNDLSFYTKWIYDIDQKLSIYSDLQYRNVQYNINGFRNNPNIVVDQKFNFLNPKLGVKYFDKATQTNVSISYAKAAKEPNRDDFEANSNEIPTAEYLNNIEFSFTTKLINKLQWNATLYYMHYRDQLILTGKINDVGAYTRQNVPNSFRAGIEITAQYQFSKIFSIEGNMSLSKNKIKSFTEYIDNYDNNTQTAIQHSNTNIAFSPSFVAGSTIIVNPIQQLEIRLLEKYVGKQYLDNTQNEQRTLNGYFLQDILLNFTPSTKKIKNLTFNLQLNNVFNKKYEPNGYTFSYISGGATQTQNFFFPMAGFNFMFGLNMRLENK